MFFGKYAVLDSPTYYFEKEPDWYWKFRPATSVDAIAKARWYDDKSVPATDENGEPIKLLPIWFERAIHELAVLFDGTNIPLDPEKPVEDGGKPILDPKASLTEREKVIGGMPPDMLGELWVALGDAVPFWGPLLLAEEDTPQDENENPNPAEDEAGKQS